MKKIGLIIGSGTGRELADTFINTLQKVAKILKRQVEIIECNYEFTTYTKLHNMPYEEIENIVKKELGILKAFYEKFYSSGGRIIFKTAINAETLYLFRRIGRAIQIIDIPASENRLLIIRDETQGFYANDQYKIEKNKIEFTASFSKENLELVANFALNEAKKALKQPFETWVVYKHHLFANVIEKWASNILPDAKVYQPNHATELLFENFFTQKKENLLLITGNEVGDILHELLMFHLGVGNRHSLFSKNVYLDSKLKGLVEYQTVHGSADDIAGKNIIDPTATLRALADIVQKEISVENFSSLMNEAIKYASEKFIYLKKPFTTSEFINFVHSYLFKILEERYQ